MNSHNPAAIMNVPKNSKKIALAGNPNVGKSVFFNYLTGLYVDVSNFPGTTIDISTGKLGEDIVMDTPGVYGVSSFNDEEKVARDIILYADVVLNVVDAVHLDRDLFLTQQIIDMGKPVVVALNMMDDVKRNGIKIDIDLLSKELGVEVIPTTAIKGEGLDKVKDALKRAKVGNRIKEVKDIIDKVIDKVDTESEALLLAEEDENIISRHNIKEYENYREYIYKLRRNRVDEIVEKVISETNENASFRIKLGRLMLRPITGIPILLLTLYLMYQAIGVFIAQTVVGVTEEIIMGGYYYNFIMNSIGKFINSSTLIGQLLIGDFGLITMVPIYILGLLLPLVVGFYFFLSLMEDSGYLPRIAALVDRLLTSLGLNGRAIIPMILGFGCVTMATITTRLLGSKREKFIATMLLGLAIPCSAQLGIIMGLIAPLGIKAFLIYSLTIFTVFVLTGTLLNKFMPGESTDLLIDLPPLRLPKLSNVLKKTYTKSVMFLKEATPLFALGGVIVTLMQFTGILNGIANALAPFTEGFLKLPPMVAQAFIMGIVRRDFGAAGLNALASQGLLNSGQIIVSLVAITLFVPCIAAIMVVFKERSPLESALIWFGSFIISFLTAGILAQFIV
ncbi:ferrous iron transport protein B [Caminicella sporogenes DSM 14501]|uniref:Ferrous iron transport protein B n=1 Tax=Caminicella sporogenes DSM 14501 TaxID=1121266 RepID=A0A1M6P0K6_9FIRM|nr:ferrous iron transport protein B [Caminicella sporogenes]RKD21575.1 ferrous iron transport protein B [Caminicella sporogenes]SHK01444.1 ferrous iron transport protein B [Caminicella sporogenes DSM 14501]